MKLIKTGVYAISLALSAASGVAAAEEKYPTKPVQIIVPWSPGQATDVAARAAAEKLTQATGQPFVVENKPGAGGSIGGAHASRAAADGYTLFAGSPGSVIISPILTEASYEVNDFKAAGLIATVPYVLLTSTKFPANNVQELIAALKKHPQKYTFASSGIGSSGHLVAELFLNQLGIEATHVPYKGSSPALTDVIGGQVDFMFDAPTSIASQIEAGKVRAYAISSSSRSSTLPNIPTVAESTDLRDFSFVSWIGLLAPKDTPAHILDYLNQQINSTLVGDDVQKRYKSLGIDLATASRQDFDKMMVNDRTRISEILKNISIKGN